MNRIFSTIVCLLRYSRLQIGWHKIFIYMQTPRSFELGVFRSHCFLHLLLRLIFKVGLGISRRNTDSQWNAVYNAFHRIKNKRSVFCLLSVKAKCFIEFLSSFHLFKSICVFCVAATDFIHSKTVNRVRFF